MTAPSPRLFARCLLLVLGLGHLSPASAETAVSGILEGDVRWSAAESPYVLSGEVVVAPAATLTIEPGTAIYMATGAGVVVRDATVVAQGTQAAPIHVLSEKARQGQPAAGDWNNWVFEPGTDNIRIEHAIFEHGKGLVLRGRQAVFNYVDIRNQAGPAIAIDLATSMTGVGNRATGNQLNAVAVPAGALSGNAQWALRGIPFLVAGRVSVGAEPVLAAVVPDRLEQGERATVVLNGQRLGGLGYVQFDQAAAEASVLPGGSDTAASLSVSVPANAPLGAVGFRAITDAGEVAIPNALTVTAMQAPTVSGMTPRAVQRGRETTIVVSGSSLGAAGVTTATGGLSVSAVSSTRTNLSFRLGVDAALPLGSYPLQIGNAAGSVTADVEILPQTEPPPPFEFVPSVVVLAPDSVYRSVIFRAAQTSAQERRYNVSVTDPGTARLRSTELVLPAGAYETSIAIAGLSVGMTVLQLAGGDLSSPLEAPVNVTSGGSTQLQISRPVGLTKGSPFVSTEGGGHAISKPVGLVKGSSMNNNAGQYIARPVGIDKGSAWVDEGAIWVSPRVGITKQ